MLMGTGGSEYIDIVSQGVDPNDEYYWGVFGLPDEDVPATVSLVHEDVEDAIITYVGAGVSIFYNGQDITGTTETPPVDYPWSKNVVVKLPLTPTPNVGQFSFSTPMSDAYEHTEEDEVRYSVCELADITANPRYIPWNDTFKESGEPEQFRVVTLRVNPHNPPITTIELEADFHLLNQKWEEISSSPGYSPLNLNCYGSEASQTIGDADLYAYQYTPYGGPYITSIHSNYTVIQPDISIEDCPDADEWTKGEGLQLNNDDDNGDDIPDNEDSYVNGPDDRLDMLTITLDLQPRDQNLGGTLKLVKKGAGKIRIFDSRYETLIMGPDDTETDAWPLVFNSIRTFLVEGVQDGGDVELRLEYTNGSFSAFDRVKLRMGCDLDIDSDNTNGYSNPGRTGDEDEMEDVSGSDPLKPGKIVVVNDGDNDDTDKDGIPDGDGIRDDLDGYGTGDAARCKGLKFVPIIFSFRRPSDPNFSLSNVRVRVTYSTASPSSDPPDGNLRIWKQQGDVHRNYQAATQGGDFVPGNPNIYTASQLGIDATNLKTTLYVEAAQPSLTIADDGHRITFELDVENDANFELSDSVRITAAKLTITKAKGLYTKDGSYEEGYLSEDEDTDGHDDGRIYCNSQHDMLTDEPMWSKNMQFVEFTVEVSPSTLSTSYTKIAFRSHDPDDPSDSGENVSEEARTIIDPNGGKGDDNTGSRDGVPEWTAVTPYTVDGVTGFATIDQDGKTVVQFNATDDGADNFVVRSGLRINQQYPMEGPRTGVMTVWKRMTIEYRRMTTDTLPVNDIQPHFDTCFVEFVIGEEGSSTNYEYLDPEPGYLDYCKKFGVGAGQFRHRGDGGWVFVCAARNKSTRNDYIPLTILAEGDAIVTGPYTYEDPQAHFPANEYIGLLTQVTGEQENTATFGITGTTDVEITIYPFQYCFPSPDDGVKENRNLETELGLWQEITYKIAEGGVTGSTATTGACLIWLETYHRGLDAGKPVGDLRGLLLHELMHTFGLQHNCGNADLTGDNACVGMQSANSTLLSGQTLERGLEFCVEHILAIRKSDGYGGEL